MRRRDVGTLLAHVLGLSVAFRDGARTLSGPTTSTAPGQVRPELPGDWRIVLPVRLDDLVEACATRGRGRGRPRSAG